MKIDKEIYRYIEHELMHYDTYKKKIKEMREEIIEESPPPSSGQPTGQGMTGKPTERKAMRLVTSTALLKMEQTVDAIDKVRKMMSDDYIKFFELNYIKQLGTIGVQCEAHISEATYHRWKYNIIYAVGRELGVI